MSLQHYQCPYCTPWSSEKRKAPHTVGKFKIKTTDSVWLVLKCVRCHKVHKIRIMGSALLWDDMSREEKHLFNRKGEYDERNTRFC